MERLTTRAVDKQCCVAKCNMFLTKCDMLSEMYRKQDYITWQQQFNPYSDPPYSQSSFILLKGYLASSTNSLISVIYI